MSYTQDKPDGSASLLGQPVHDSGPNMHAKERPQVPKKKPHISETSVTWTNWHKHANWLNIIFILGIPMSGVAATAWVPLRWPTAIWAIVYYFLTGLGITAGYHRLWSHTSYSARLPLQIFLAAVGGGAVQGSIQWWSRGHRAHHRYTDTEKDPYSVNKGILYAHFGWMLLKQDPNESGGQMSQTSTTTR
jgi:stearoyl-CoA desaturase (delta-9 desaturase)